MQYTKSKSYYIDRAGKTLAEPGTGRRQSSWSFRAASRSTCELMPFSLKCSTSCRADGQFEFEFKPLGVFVLNIVFIDRHNCLGWPAWPDSSLDQYDCSFFCTLGVFFAHALLTVWGLLCTTVASYEHTRRTAELSTLCDHPGGESLTTCVASSLWSAQIDQLVVV